MMPLEAQSKIRLTLLRLRKAKEDKLFADSEPENKWRYIRVETVNAAIRLIEQNLWKPEGK